MTQKIYVVEFDPYGTAEQPDVVNIFWDKDAALKFAKGIVETNSDEDDLFSVNVYEQVPFKYGTFTTIRTHRFKPNQD